MMIYQRVLLALALNPSLDQQLLARAQQLLVAQAAVAEYQLQRQQTNKAQTNKTQADKIQTLQADAANFLSPSPAVQLHVLHVIENSQDCAADLSFAPGSGGPDELQQEVQAYMARLAESLTLPLQQHIQTGVAAERIIETAAKIDADLIILGAQDGKALGALLGSSAQAVLQAANCDVLSVSVKQHNKPA